MFQEFLEIINMIESMNQRMTESMNQRMTEWMNQWLNESINQTILSYRGLWKLFKKGQFFLTDC